MAWLLNLSTKSDFTGQQTWDRYRINIGQSCVILAVLKQSSWFAIPGQDRKGGYMHRLIMKGFPVYPPASTVQLWERFRAWMVQETLQSSKWACWGSSCQQIRSLSLWPCGLMIKPFNKSILGIANTHADAQGFSATNVEHYKILDKQANLLEEGRACAPLRPGSQTLNLTVTGCCFVTAF